MFLSLIAVAVAALTGADPASAASESRISDEVIPRTTEGMERTPPLLELGPSFLDTGNIPQGIELPTGAVWQPQLLLFGSLRTALQTFDDGTTRRSEWANRLDVFAQLRLSGTERLLLGLRPLDQDNNFSGYYFEPDNEIDGWREDYNGNITTLFFEGDFGEIFPNLDPDDSKALDWGFSIGRQPVFKQEGMLINDTLDAVGVVRNSIIVPGTSNVRVTGLYSWNDIHRDDNEEDTSASLAGLFAEIDFPWSTVDVDFAYVDADEKSGGDGYFFGLSGVQRIGHVNSAFRALYSKASDGDSNAVSTGTLLFGELSWTPPRTHNNLYLNGFWGIDQFASAARAPDAGGPLGRTGILFAAVGLGRYGAALGNRADDAFGGSLGYQMFFAGTRKQLIIEAGGRDETKGPNNGAVAIGARYQQAVGTNIVVSLDGFVGDRERGGTTNGARVEVLYKY